jgi:WD40 repeat protein/mono/diheme cytochrome c family protein
VASLLWIWPCLCVGMGAGETPGPGPAPTTAQVLEVFNRRCVECHGIAKQSAKLRLDTLDGIFRGGKSGPAVHAGKSEGSLLFQKVAPGAEKRMPPKGDPLTDEEVALVRRWIDSGAKAVASESAGRALSPAEVSVNLKPLPAGFQPLFALAGDPVGSRIAVGRGELVEVLSVPPAGEDGKPQGKVEKAAKLGGHSDLVQSLAFSPDGKRLASGEFRTARVWDASGPASGGEPGEFPLLRTFGPHADRVLAVVFTPDSRRLLTGGGVPTESGEVKLWDVDSGSLVWSASPHSDTVLALAVSGDGNTVITGAADRTTYLLDGKTGKTIRRLEGHTHHVLSVALSPDGKLAATAGADHLLRVWDLGGGEPHSHRGHEGAVTSVQFIREGKGLITSGGDGSIRFWNPGSRGQEGSLGEAKGYLQAGSAFAAGKRYAAGEEEGAVRIYDLEKKRLLFTVEPEPAPAPAAAAAPAAH